MTKTFCDKCDKEITGMFDGGAKHVIAVRGGYASVFGDGTRVYIELCQECLYDLLNNAGLLNERTIKETMW